MRRLVPDALRNAADPARALVAAALAVALLTTLGPAAACGGSETGASYDDDLPADSDATVSTAPTGYTDISPDELAGMLEDEDILLVNTHIPYEGEIERTDLFLPYDQAAALISELPADKDARIIVYCRSDRMSRIAAEEWAKAGYTDLYNLDGGFVAWEAAGYELLHLPQE